MKIYLYFTSLICKKLVKPCERNDDENKHTTQLHMQDCFQASINLKRMLIQNIEIRNQRPVSTYIKPRSSLLSFARPVGVEVMLLN